MRDDQSKTEAAQERLKGFAKHLVVYFILIAICVAINLMNSPESLWILFPMFGWSPALALHAAYAMGMFTSLNKS